MRVKRYEGSTMKEALDKVRADLGPEAVILDARQCRARGFAKVLSFFGMNRKPAFEVLAAIDGDEAVRAPKFSVALERAQQNEAEIRSVSALSQSDGEPLAEGDARRREPDKGVSEESGQPARGDFAPDRQGIGFVTESQGVDATLNVIARESAVRARVSSLPPEMAAVYQFLVEEDVSEKTAFRLANAVASECGNIPAESDEILRWAFDEVAKMVDVSGPIEIVRGRRKVVAFVGPTGVGKTTTIAKIAAGAALVEKAKVALITADTYRIAAIEQIKTYAEIIGVPWEVVYSPRDMEMALVKRSDAELVLIDTAGRSPNSPTRMYELKSMMDAALPEEIHLVLSATTRRQDLDNLVDRFAQVGFDKVILTKLDESSTLGAIFNVYARSGRPFSYFADGQSVPEDIHPATCSEIAEMMSSHWRKTV